jgi:hypothetical protein
MLLWNSLTELLQSCWSCLRGTSAPASSAAIPMATKVPYQAVPSADDYEVVHKIVL